MRRGFDDLSHAYTSTQVSQRNRETDAFVHWIGPQSRDTALDVATGPATIARALAPRVRCVVGLDLSHSMLLEASFLKPPATNLRLAAGDIAGLPFADAAFDLLTCAYAFANLPDLPLALRECSRVVASGGHLAFMDVIASEDPSEREHLNRLEAMRSDFYTRIRTRSEFMDNFQGAGLRVEKSKLSSGTQRMTDWLQLSPALKVKARSSATDPGKIIDLAAKAGLDPEDQDGDVEFRYQTAWFLLRRV